MSTFHAAHHFDDVAQQRHAVDLGMWAFLAGEVLLFSVLFTGYTAARWTAPQAFSEAGHHLYKWLGVTNAAVLLISSGAMAFAVETDPARPRVKSRWLFVTAALGLVFAGIKAVEYTLDIREGLLPGSHFDASKFTSPASSEMMLVFYWIMTGLHAFHVMAGVAVISSFAIRLRARNADRSLTLDNGVRATGLYWHLVDIIWLFLLPILYLNP